MPPMATTGMFTAAVTALSLGLGLLLAVKADAVIRGRSAYRTALISVYAIIFFFSY